MATINRAMIPIFARLVLLGTWTIDPEDKTKKLVPKHYQIPVAEYLAEREAKQAGAEEE